MKSFCLLVLLALPSGGCGGPPCPFRPVEQACEGPCLDYRDFDPLCELPTTKCGPLESPNAEIDGPAFGGTVLWFDRAGTLVSIRRWSDVLGVGCAPDRWEGWYGPELFCERDPEPSPAFCAE